LAKRNHKVHFGIWFLIFIGVGGMVFASSSANEFFTFKLSHLGLDDSFDNFEGNFDVPDIVCNVKSTVQGKNSSGEVVLVAQSTAFEKHPKTTFSLVGGQNNSPVVTFEIANKMRCDFPDGNFVPMTVSTSELKVVIFAKNSAGVEKEIWNNLVRSTSPVPIINNHEETLSVVSANTIDLDKYLEQGEYETTMRIVTYGTITIFYDGFKSVKFDIVIPDNKIVSFITLDVTKDTPKKDGDPPKTPEPKSGDDGIDITGTLLAFQVCLSTLNIDCLSNQIFMPYYLGGIGIVVLAGAVSSRNSKMAFDQFGNRM